MAGHSDNTPETPLLADTAEQTVPPCEVQPRVDRSPKTGRVNAIEATSFCGLPQSLWFPVFIFLVGYAMAALAFSCPEPNGSIVRQQITVRVPSSRRHTSKSVCGILQKVWHAC